MKKNKETQDQKLVVMIPAYNEERTIGQVIKEIPRKIPGISEVLVLVIDDGCTDKTVEVAIKAGANIIIHHKMNKGLAPSFRDGLEASLKIGAGIIVNTDADFQYDQREIPNLIKPIQDHKADLVLSYRDIFNLDHMPLSKKIGNKIATKVTQIASNYPVIDGQSGYRAFSREAALKMNVMSNYTYVQETIIQAVNKGLCIKQVPCAFRKRQGKSRLISNVLSYARNGAGIILRTYRDYSPLKVFVLGGSVFLFVSAAIGFVVLKHFITTGMLTPYHGRALLSTLFGMTGIMIMVFGLLADMIRTQRMMLEDALYRLKKMKFGEDATD